MNDTSSGLSALLRKLKVKATAGTADLCGSLTWNDGKAYKLMSISSVIEPPVNYTDSCYIFFLELSVNLF